MTHRAGRLHQIAPRARGLTSSLTSITLRVLERFRQSTERLLEQGGAFRAGLGKAEAESNRARQGTAWRGRAWQGEAGQGHYKGYLLALQRITTGSGGRTK